MLLQAAIHNHCRLYVQKSITFIHGVHGESWVDEQTPVDPHRGGILQSAVDMEALVREAAKNSSLPSIILRFGRFYCYDSVQTQAIFDNVRKGTFPVIESGDYHWSNIQVDDGAQAVRNAIEHQDRDMQQMYNICDDEPATYRANIDSLAGVLGAGIPKHIPQIAAKLQFGELTYRTLVSSYRCTNRLAKEKLGCSPEHPSSGEGYRSEVEKWLASPAIAGRKQ